MNEIKLDLEQFNEFNRNGKPIRVCQQDIVDNIIENYNFFFLGSSADYPYMYENGVYNPISSPKFYEGKPLLIFNIIATFSSKKK